MGGIRSRVASLDEVLVAAKATIGSAQDGGDVIFGASESGVF